MEWIFNWVFGHSLLSLVIGVAAFVLWFASPITWRDGEGGVVESGENVRDNYNLLRGLGSFWGGR